MGEWDSMLQPISPVIPTKTGVSRTHDCLYTMELLLVMGTLTYTDHGRRFPYSLYGRDSPLLRLQSK